MLAADPTQLAGVIRRRRAGIDTWYSLGVVESSERCCRSPSGSAPRAWATSSNGRSASGTPPGSARPWRARRARPETGADIEHGLPGDGGVPPGARSRARGRGRGPDGSPGRGPLIPATTPTTMAGAAAAPCAQLDRPVGDAQHRGGPPSAAVALLQRRVDRDVTDERLRSARSGPRRARRARPGPGAGARTPRAGAPGRRAGSAAARHPG